MKPSTRIAFTAVLLSLCVSGCHKKHPGNVVGTWMGMMRGANATLTLNADNTWSFVGSPPANQIVTYKASGTYVLNGTTIAYTPTEADVVGPIGPDQRDELKKKLLQPETDELDFTGPDDMTESASNGNSMTFHRTQ